MTTILVNDFGLFKLFTSVERLAHFQSPMLTKNGSFIIDHGQNELWGKCASGNQFVIPQAPKLLSIQKSVYHQETFNFPLDIFPEIYKKGIHICWYDAYKK